MSDLFLGICIGFVIGGICFGIIEALCIMTGKSDIDKWTEEDDEKSNR